MLYIEWWNVTYVTLKNLFNYNYIFLYLGNFNNNFDPIWVCRKRKFKLILFAFVCRTVVGQWRKQQNCSKTAEKRSINYEILSFRRHSFIFYTLYIMDITCNMFTCFWWNFFRFYRTFLNWLSIFGFVIKIMDYFCLEKIAKILLLIVQIRVSLKKLVKNCLKVSQ